MPRKPNKNRTIAVNAGIGIDPRYGAVSPPLYMSSTYKFSDLNDMGRYDYGRGGNPTRDMFAKTLAELEGGFDGIITSSGMAALDLCLNLVPVGGRVLAAHDCYGGTHRLLEARAQQGRFSILFINFGDEHAFNKAMDEYPSMILIETPSNPLMRLVDIAKVTSKAKSVGAISVCDNTFMSPVRQNPLALGADIVVHSCTKFINGHSDVISGAVIAKNEAHHTDLTWWANCTGTTGAPFDCYQALRGLRTLYARMDAQEANAIEIAAYLNTQNLVDTIHYPGLKSHRDYELANQQQSGPGAVLSFCLKGELNLVRGFFKDTGLFQLAESLGGTESLISHPASMTHRAMSESARTRAGICDGLVRVSVGLEHIDDLKLSLEVMFKNAREHSDDASE